MQIQPKNYKLGLEIQDMNPCIWKIGYLIIDANGWISLVDIFLEVETLSEFIFNCINVGFNGSGPNINTELLN